MAQVVNSPRIIFVFHTNAHPDVGWPGDEMVKLAKFVRPLAQDLKLVPIRTSHNVKHTQYVIGRHFFLEKMTHGVDEIALSLSPMKRQIKHVRLNRTLATIS